MVTTASIKEVVCGGDYPLRVRIGVGVEGNDEEGDTCNAGRDGDYGRGEQYDANGERGGGKKGAVGTVVLTVRTLEGKSHDERRLRPTVGQGRRHWRGSG